MIRECTTHRNTRKNIKQIKNKTTALLTREFRPRNTYRRRNCETTFHIIISVVRRTSASTRARAPGRSKQSDFDFFNFFFHISSYIPNPYPIFHNTPHRLYIYLYTYICTISTRRSPMTPYENWFPALSLRYIYL
jgi:hypothetical protein